MVYLFVTRFLFQSTHPQGVRPLISDSSATLISISIHAPTRSATHRRRYN